MPSETRSRWFFGPVPDLLLGCGLVYVVFFAWQLFDGASLRRWLPDAMLPFLILVLGAPHYGATLLRVYERREDRRRYVLFAGWATAAIVALFLGGLRSAVVGSFVVTLYFTWSPWHYAGQNYGLAVLFLRRRGVPLATTTKRLLYATFLLSYALVFLALHTAGPVLAQAPASLDGTIYHFASLGIPRAARDVLAPLLLAAYVACLGGAAWRLRGARWRDLGPSASLVLLQLLWFLLPTAAGIWRVGDRLDPVQHRAYAFMWIAVGHFAQYLWITTYYAAASADTSARLRYLTRTLVVGIAIWTVPVLLFAPGWTGGPPYDLGLGLLTASAVNLHHFVLDGAIWKLRDGRVARMLLRAPGEPVPVAVDEASPSARPRAWPRLARGAAWAGGWAVLAIAVGVQYELWAGNRAARATDRPRVRTAVERLERVGYESPTVYVRLARRDLEQGDLHSALASLRQARAIYPTAEMWTTYGAVYERAGDPSRALAAYDRALELDPDSVAALANSARVLRRRGDDRAARERAERAAALSPLDPRLRLLAESLGAGRGSSQEPSLSASQDPAR